MNILKCPVCNTVLEKEQKTYKCSNNHTFDIAKQGYTNLLRSNQTKIHGDSKDMLLARKEVLYGNYYASISKQLNHVITSLNPNTILDLGAGIGYYSDMLQQALPNKHYYGIDISKLGMKEAAKENKEITYVVGSNNKLPFIDESFDLIFSVFSPIYIEEVLRTLSKQGYLVTVSPNQNHLMELKELVYKTIVDKDYQVNIIEEEQLTFLKKIDVKETVTVPNPFLYQLFTITPHYWKTPEEGKITIKQQSSLDVGIDVVITIYQKQ